MTAGGGGGEVERRAAAQMQLREQICAREYANSSFVSAVDWPLCRTSAREGRRGEELGHARLPWRPSQVTTDCLSLHRSVSAKDAREALLLH